MENKTVSILPDKRVSFAPNHAVLLQLVPPFFKRVYGLREVFSSDGLETVLKYEISITYKKTIAQNLRIFEIERVSPLYINDCLPETVAEQLALQTGSVFYPLQIHADFSGSYVSVANIEIIQQRWKTVKESILEYFTGEETENYLTQMEKVINDEDRIDNAIRKDLVIRTFFAGLYKSYQQDLELTEDLYFPLVGDSSPLAFSVRQTVNPLYNDSDQLEIRHEGVSIDERSAADLIRQDDFATMRYENEAIPKVEASYKARYALNAVTKSIEALEVYWEINLQLTESVSISMYELSDADRQSEELLANASVTKEKEDSSPGGFSKFMKTLFG
ncbi:hypothetical protein TH53_15120 [Pedobacter lusitanus]|uniref:Uncharacterized protein n=1 Tax=Pedobacter lusitanus TaxID=1503925 RepID=A0A0D0FVE3_9SPHI|nr:hypothetical protein [Pedobacter lusitanus]KIO76399.1 hypothetical protein TH53_15120 [Pedobacter lusitanus]